MDVCRLVHVVITPEPPPIPGVFCQDEYVFRSIDHWIVTHDMIGLEGEFTIAQIKGKDAVKPSIKAISWRYKVGASIVV